MKSKFLLALKKFALESINSQQSTVNRALFGSFMADQRSQQAPSIAGAIRRTLERADSASQRRGSPEPEGESADWSPHGGVICDSLISINVGWAF